MGTAGVLFAVGSLLSLLMTCQATKVYTVGDEAGWTLDYDYQKWASGKTFYVGDTLVFKYFNSEMGNHNVVRVSRTGYTNCVIDPNMGVYESGSDKIVLSAPGDMWFICGTPGHCESGMKLKITVKKPAGIPAPSPAPAQTTDGITTPSPAPAQTTDGIPAASPDSSPASAPDSILPTWLPWH
ncbi:hypothetical protein SUGI_0872760 [Cryptomeria japonica]|nr:hypothetical protein SUGI_0872760 [Cryptomeria japonica]